MKSKSPLFPLALLIALPTSIGVAVGQQAKSANLSYEVINLGTPLGGTLAAVQTISLQGFLAGYANLPDNAQHAILFELSGTKDLGTLGGQNSAILGGLSGFSETATSDPLGRTSAKQALISFAWRLRWGTATRLLRCPRWGARPRQPLARTLLVRWSESR